MLQNDQEEGGKEGYESEQVEVGRLSSMHPTGRADLFSPLSSPSLQAIRR